MAGDHYFEWHSQHHHYPIVTILFSIHPGFHFPSPKVQFNNHPHYSCPSIIITWWNRPTDLPTETKEYLLNLEEQLDRDLFLFIAHLEGFILSFYYPVNPYNLHTNQPFHPQLPPFLPHTPANPFTTPLVTER